MLPGGRHSRKKGKLPTTPCRQSQSRNRWLHAGDFTKMTLYCGYIRGYEKRPEWFGPTSSVFFDLVQSGTLPHRAAWLVHKRRHGSRTNGSVMRGFPLGIFYPAPEVYEVSLACSQLTHYDPVAAHCSAFLNVMVSDMCRGFPAKRHSGMHARCARIGSAYSAGQLCGVYPVPRLMQCSVRMRHCPAS